MSKTRRTSFIFFIVSLATISVAYLAGRFTASQNATATPPVTFIPSESSPMPTSTPAGPLPLREDNYSRLSRLYTWEVGGRVTRVTGIALSEAGQKVALLVSLAAEEESYGLQVYDLQGNLSWQISLQSKAAYPAIAFSPDGSKVVIGLGNGAVEMYDARDGTLIRELGKHLWAVRVIVFSPDGRLVASGSSDQQVGLWEVDSAQRIPTCFFWDPVRKIRCRPQNKTDVRDLAFSPDGRYLAVSANVVVILNTRTGQEIDRFYDEAGETRDLAEVAFSPDARTFAASGDWYNIENGRWRKRLLVWTYPTPINRAVKIPLEDALEDLIFSADERLLVGTYKDRGKLVVFDVAERDVVGVIELGPIMLLSYSPDLRLFAILATNTSVSIWGIQQ